MEVASPTLHDIVLAHISQNNNTPAIAYKHASQALWKSGFHEDIHIHYTKQRTPLYPIVIGDDGQPNTIIQRLRNIKYQNNIINCHRLRLHIISSTI